MKVLEVITTTPVRDPHRQPLTSMSQRSEYKAADGYELELHPSGLAVIIRGRDHTRLAPIASAIVEEDEEAEVGPTRLPARPPAKKRGVR